MIFDLETHLRDLLNTLEKDIPKDADGTCQKGFWTQFNFESRGWNVARSLYWKFDDLYVGKLLGYVEPNVVVNEKDWHEDSYNSLCAGWLIDQEGFEPISSWEDCQRYLDKIVEMYPLLEERVTSTCIDLLENCLRLAWAIIRCGNDHNEILFGQQLKEVSRLCDQALTNSLLPEELQAKVEKLAPQVVIEKPKPSSGKNWSKDQVFYFEQCYRIFQTSSRRNRKGHRLGPFSVCDEDGRVIETIPAGQGAVKAVFAYVEENIRTLSKGAVLTIGKSVKKQYYDWEKEQASRS